MALSFIYPDRELDVRIIRLLTVLKYNSVNKKNNPILSIDKISVFEFLLEHPYILFKIIIDTGKKSLFTVNEIELNSISKEFPNTNNLYSFLETKNILVIMIAKKLVDVSLISNNVYYIITEEGLRFLEETSTVYTDRLGVISLTLVNLNSESYKNLLTLIKPYTNGK
jgi:hypothetical protein